MQQITIAAITVHITSTKAAHVKSHLTGRTGLSASLLLAFSITAALAPDAAHILGD